MQGVDEPVTVEPTKPVLAMQWTGDNFEAIRKVWPKARLRENADWILEIPGMRGLPNLFPGTWIVQLPWSGFETWTATEHFEKRWTVREG